ncbi:hypothetical protein JKY72_00885 [Candidatus Gracilibacteria bacterium]|nr:hypothetical protein [Candidatus Gracilibacteria bacterium]
MGVLETIWVGTTHAKLSKEKEHRREIDDKKDPKSMEISSRINSLRATGLLQYLSYGIVALTIAFGGDAMRAIEGDPVANRPLQRKTYNPTARSAHSPAPKEAVFVANDPTTKAVFKFLQTSGLTAAADAAKIIKDNPEFAARDRTVRDVVFGPKGLVAKNPTGAQMHIANNFRTNAVPFFNEYADLDGSLFARLGSKGFFTAPIENQKVNNQAKHDWFAARDIPYYEEETRRLFIPDYHDRAANEWNQYWYRLAIIATMDAQPVMVGIKNRMGERPLMNMLGGGLSGEFSSTVPGLINGMVAVTQGMVNLLPDSVHEPTSLNTVGIVEVFRTAAETIIGEWMKDENSRIAKFISAHRDNKTEVLMYFIIRAYLDTLMHDTDSPEELKELMWEIADNPDQYIGRQKKR